MIDFDVVENHGKRSDLGSVIFSNLIIGRSEDNRSPFVQLGLNPTDGIA